MTQRMTAWRSFPKKESPWEELPSEFREVKGSSDPPLAEYSYLVEIQDLVDAYISPEMQRTMCVMMVAKKLGLARKMELQHRA